MASSIDQKIDSPSTSNIPRALARNTPPQDDAVLWRLPTVLEHVPVSQSGWRAGVRAGKYPQPVKIGARAVAWRASDIRALVASL